MVAVFCLYLFFYGLGSFGLVGADEPRYAQVAREMLERDDYVTPTLNGEGWFEKPALYYWRAMFAFETFGVKDWAARIPSASFALGMVAVIFFHMRRFRPGAQLDAALITASCAAVIGFARGASTDMQLAAPFTVAMLGWYAWYETGKKIWLVDLYAFLAIATLAKGPVAPFLAGAVVLLFCLLRHEWRTALRTLWLPGIGLFLLIALPWYVLVSLKNPTFPRVFILEHNLARFSSDMFRHAQPSWYYIPVLMLALVPWTFFSMPALVEAFRACLKDWRAVRSERKTGVEADRVNVDAFPEFLVIWALVPIIFFSLSRSKLPGYILPAIAPLTILTADYLQRKGNAALTRLSVLAHAALSAVIVALFVVFPYYFLQQMPITASGKALILLLAAAFMVGIYYALHLGGTRYLRFVTLLPVVLIIGFILKIAAPTIDNHYSARPVAHELSGMKLETRPLAVFQVRRDLRYGLGFYRNQRIWNYDEGEIPATEHVLVANAAQPDGRAELERKLPGRKLLRVGGFPAQKLDFYWVSGDEPSPRK